MGRWGTATPSTGFEIELKGGRERKKRRGGRGCREGMTPPWKGRDMGTLREAKKKEV